MIKGRKVTIIGGAAVDIISKSNSIKVGSPESHNSHIGEIFMLEGGSARNTAECLGRLGLGADLTFISGVGDDEKKTLIERSLEQVGVSPEGLIVKPGQRTAAFSGVLNNEGDLFFGIADMKVLEELPRPELLAAKFNESKVLLIDSNIEEETLDFILANSS